MEIHNTIDSRIKIAYGYKEKSGVFLKVRYELNKEDLDIGIFMEFYTGSKGIGHKTEKEKMKVLMKRFLVPDDELNILFANEAISGFKKPLMAQSTSSGTNKNGSIALSTEKEKTLELQEGENGGISVAGEICKSKKKKNRNKAKKSGSKAMAVKTSTDGSTPEETYTDISTKRITTGDCLHCGETAEKRCSKCNLKPGQISYYCSKKCWEDNRHIHEHICSLEMPPKKFHNSSEYSVDKCKSVYGIILEENTTKPGIVDVTIERKWDTDVFKYYFDANVEQFLGNPGSLTFIYENPLKPYRKFPNFFAIFYLPDNLLTDKSMPNKCVQAITCGQTAHHWRGPILVLKCRGTDYANLNPIDVKLSDDFIDIIDFFKTIKKEELRALWRC